MLRAAISNTSRTAFVARSHAFHTTPVAAKTVTEKVTEVADKVCVEAKQQVLEHLPRIQVNKSVGRGLASAIDKGEKVTEATKETIGARVWIRWLSHADGSFLRSQGRGG